MIDLCSASACHGAYACRKIDGIHARVCIWALKGVHGNETAPVPYQSTAARTQSPLTAAKQIYHSMRFDRWAGDFGIVGARGLAKSQISWHVRRGRAPPRSRISLCLHHISILCLKPLEALMRKIQFENMNEVHLQSRTICRYAFAWVVLSCGGIEMLACPVKNSLTNSGVD